MSNYHHGSQSNNTHHVAVSGDMLMSPTSTVYVNLNASNESGKKNPSDLFKPTEATIDGSSRFIKRTPKGMVVNDDSGFFTYRFGLPTLIKLQSIMLKSGQIRRLQLKRGGRLIARYRERSLARTTTWKGIPIMWLLFHLESGGWKYRESEWLIAYLHG